MNDGINNPNSWPLRKVLLTNVHNAAALAETYGDIQLAGVLQTVIAAFSEDALEGAERRLCDALLEFGEAEDNRYPAGEEAAAEKAGRTCG